MVLTGYGSIATTIDAMRLGAVYYLQKLPRCRTDIYLAAPSRARAPPLEALPDDRRIPPRRRAWKWGAPESRAGRRGGNVSEAARKLKLRDAVSSGCCRSSAAGVTASGLESPIDAVVGPLGENTAMPAEDTAVP